MDDAKRRAQDSFTTLQKRGVRLVDTYVPPDRRNDLIQQLRSWTSQHPKLATLLALHLTLSLPSLLLFLAFALFTTATTLLVALTTAITLALSFSLAVLTLTFLIILLPTLILTTSIATALFLLAVVASTTSYWFSTTSNSRIKSLRSSAAQTATAASDRIKGATQGRVDADGIARQIGSMGSPAVEGLALYREDLAKMRNADGTNGSTPRLASGNGFDDREAGEAEKARLARQALGIPAE